jgi:hypothetical protein
MEITTVLFGILLRAATLSDIGGSRGKVLVGLAQRRYNKSMRSVTAAIYNSFEEADQADRARYRSMTPAERLELISQLRALLHGPDDASAPRLERVLRITELSRG